MAKHMTMQEFILTMRLLGVTVKIREGSRLIHLSSLACRSILVWDYTEPYGFYESTIHKYTFKMHTLNEVVEQYKKHILKVE